MSLGSHLEDAVHEDFRAVLGEEAQDIGDELIAGAIRVDADAEGLHALAEAGSGKGMDLVEVHPSGDGLVERGGLVRRVFGLGSGGS